MQWLQLLFTTGLKNENLEIRPSNEPTGQIVLQYNLPLKALNTTTNSKKNRANINEPATNTE